MANSIYTKTPEKKVLLERYTINTDLDTWSEAKKILLFEAATDAIESSKGTLSQELKKLVKNMLFQLKTAKKECKQLKEEKASNERIIQELQEDQRNKETTPIYSSGRSYAEVTMNKKEEHVIIIKSKTTNNNTDLRTEFLRKIKPIEKEIAITDQRKKGDKLVVKVKDKQQQHLICSSLENDLNIEATQPSKRIPTIKIKEVDRNYDEATILEELREKEDINTDAAVIKKIVKNLKFKTNRVIINLNAEDTLKVVRQEGIKLGPIIHPIEVDYGIIQCYKCYKFGHFHMSKDGTTVTCKSEHQICSHCGKNHKFSECNDKEERKKAKCSNCNQNHRATDTKCSKRLEVVEKMKRKFIC